jgi:Myosin-crossreactive antigen
MKGRANGKTAYIIGAGLSGLSAAFFLLNNEGMKGSSIHIFENEQGKSYQSRFILYPGGVPSYFDDSFWKMMAEIPSLENSDNSILDEFHNANPVSEKTDNSEYSLTSSAWRELLTLITEKDSDLKGKSIASLLSSAVTDTSFFRFITAFSGLRVDDSALELKNLIKHYGEDISSLFDYSVFKFPKYSPFESIVEPLISYLKEQSVIFENGTTVEDVRFGCRGKKKYATSITVETDEIKAVIGLEEDDLVFITLANRFENVSYGSSSKAAKPDWELKKGSSFALWKRIAEKDMTFGNPEMLFKTDARPYLYTQIKTKSERVISLIEKKTGINPYCGKKVTSGALFESESNWGINWFVPSQPCCKKQDGDEVLGFLYGVTPEERGNYIKKTMYECTGRDIANEWLFHMGAGDDIKELSTLCDCTPITYPFFYGALLAGRELAIPEVHREEYGNFAFLGEYAALEGISTLSVEGQVKEAEFAVGSLLEKGYRQKYFDNFSLSSLLSLRQYLLSGQKLDGRTMNLKERTLCKRLLKALSGTDFEKLFEEYKVIDKQT